MVSHFKLLLLAIVLLLPISSGLFVVGRSQPVVAQSVDSRKAEGDRLRQQGIEQFQISQFEAALRSWQQALTLYQAIHDRLGEGRSLGNLGVAYHVLGNYGKAIEYQEQSLAIARKIKDRLGEGNALGNLGVAYRSLGNYGKAIEYYEQRLAIARKIKDRLGEGNALRNLGNAYHVLGNYGKAIEYQEQSLAIARDIKDRLGEEQSLGNLGNAYHDLGNYDKAIEYYEQRLAIARDIKDRLGEEQSLGNLGNAYHDLGNYGKAIEYEEQGLAIAREIKNRLDEGIALNNLGSSLFKSGSLSRAEKTLLDGIAVRESIRQGVGNNDANKISVFEAQARTYRILQQVLVSANKPTAALEIAERGRARAFVELLTRRLAAGQATDQQGRASINTPAATSDLASVAPPSLAQMQQTAKAQNASLVQYSIIYDDFKTQGKQETHESELYIWVIQPSGKITFRKADLKPLWQQQKTSLAELVENSRKGIGVSDRGDRATLKISLTPEYLQQLHKQQSRYLRQLHHLLIEPIADLLPTDPNQRVIFIPQGELFLVPFAALQDKSDQYLIQQHTISIAPAIQVLGLTHQQRQALQPATNVLVAGNPIMPQVTVPGADAPLVLPDLPGAKDEAIAVAKTLSTTALTGKQAVKRAIVQQMQTARIIHLATHGLLDDFKGLGVPGAIVLAPDGNGQPNDGLLTADDILSMKLKAELVVLSACNTGRGKLTGDGVIGLSRSLISAGTPSVMVSLWSVPDAPTASLMTDFYQNWQTTHLDKAQALRQAMLNTMKSHPDPRDWAAFTLIGEAQ